MAKEKRKYKCIGPPSEGLPAKWTIEGVEYKIQSTDVQTDVVEIKDENGQSYFVNYYDLKRRLKELKKI